VTEQATEVEPASRAEKARPVPVVRPDTTPMAQVSTSPDRPLLTVRDRQLPVLRARGGHGRRGRSWVWPGSDADRLNRRVRLVHDDHLPRMRRRLTNVLLLRGFAVVLGCRILWPCAALLALPALP
jgi:hypothetical protein